MKDKMKLTFLLPEITRSLFMALPLLALPVIARSQSHELDPISMDEDNWMEDRLSNINTVSNLDFHLQGVAPRWYSMFSDVPKAYSRGAEMLLNSESVPTVAGIGALTFGLIETDNATWHATRKFYRQSTTNREIASYVIALGDGRLHLAIAGVFAGYGWLADDSRALRTASQTVEAFLATGLTVQLLKRVTGRESPASATHHSGRWKFCPNLKQYNKHQSSYYAFPSGHISTAMATLTVVAENYPQERWIRPVGYALTGALGVGLVAKGMHWYSDLPLGVGIGYLFGKVVASPEASEPTTTSREGGVKVSLGPTFDGQRGSGIHLAVAF